ncbi:MAG: transporter [Betaproteobacteria bacterium]|nr:transporter [Betaproteobacteria bacterium]
MARLEGLVDRLETPARPNSSAERTPGPMAASRPASQGAGEAAPRPARPGSPGGGPGSFSVDEAAAQRALERTLTQTGALLLAPHQIDVEPSVSFTRQEISAPTYYFLGSNLVLDSQQIRRDEIAANLAVKIGLPWESQVEFGLPYNYVHQSQVADLGAAGRFAGTAHGSGWGDFSVGLAKTFTHEAGWRPDLIGRITYTVGQGSQQDNGVVMPGGNPSAQVQLVALQRQDPLAFVGSLFYQKSFEKDQIRQGDQVGFSLGTLLAASPQTSLQFAFNQTFARDTQVNGSDVPGSEQTIGMFNVGASSILNKNVMLNVVLGIGLSSDAPKYMFQITLPIRFD